MANESLIQVPPNVEEPIVLQRFLLRLVEELDIILGKRASSSDDEYVAQKELLDSAEALTLAIKEAQERLSEASELLEQELDNVRNDINDELDAIKDINDTQTEQINQLTNFSWLRPFTVAFPGRSTNGTVTPNLAYNIASVTRSAIGVYDIVMEQPLDSQGDLLLSRTQQVLSHNIADSAISEDYTVKFGNVNAAAGTFTISVVAIEQGAGNKLVFTPYDPLSTDNVNVMGMYTPVGAVIPT